MSATRNVPRFDFHFGDASVRFVTGQLWIAHLCSLHVVIKERAFEDNICPEFLRNGEDLLVSQLSRSAGFDHRVVRNDTPDHNRVEGSC